MKKLGLNKRGQFQSTLLAVILIFVFGIILFFFNHFNKAIYEGFDDVFNESSRFNNTEAHDAIDKLQALEGSNIWDWAFLALFMGQLIVMLLLSFSTRTNIAFFWIFVILGIVILMVGTMLSNIWQDISDDDEFVDTIARFPITNALLGTYAPQVIMAILFFGMIVLFGKPPGIGK